MENSTKIGAATVAVVSSDDRSADEKSLAIATSITGTGANWIDYR